MQVTRNLATRLVTKVLTVEVRRTSNSLGICGNKGLDNAKLIAVHDVTMKNYVPSKTTTNESNHEGGDENSNPHSM